MRKIDLVSFLAVLKELEYISANLYHEYSSCVDASFEIDKVIDELKNLAGIEE